jgi:IS5 family transposase
VSIRITVDGITETVNEAQPIEVLTLLRDSTLDRIKRKTAEKERYENAAIAAGSDVEALADTLHRYNATLLAIEATSAPAPVATFEEQAPGIEAAAA